MVWVSVLVLRRLVMLREKVCEFAGGDVVVAG
jgi:hypothetical protein